MAVAGTTLDLDAINALLAGSRTRGDYGDTLREFISSGEAGIEVDLSSGNLAGKDAKNAATGFKNAAKKMGDNGQPAIPGSHLVKVLLRNVKTGAKDAEGNDVEEGHVFLINTAKLGGAEAAAVAAEEDAQSEATA